MLHSNAVPAPDACPSRPPGMLQRLLAAEGDAAHQSTVLALLQANGFDAMSYGRLQGHAGGGWSWADVASYGEAPALGADLPHPDLDPRLALALRSCLPVFWSLDELLRSPPERARFVQQAVVRPGFQSGATLALAGPAAGERSVVHLLSRRAHSGRDIDDALFGRVLVLGLGVHDHHSRLPAASRAGVPTLAGGLTARQRDVLRCLAVGLADKQIADRLDMSLHTVDYHMRQLRKRFGARNRLQLTQLSERAM